MTFIDAYSGARDSAEPGSAAARSLINEGGQLKVVNSGFIDNRCFR